MIELSDEVIVVADSSKLGRSAFSRVASLSDIDILVTNRREDSPEIEAIRAMGGEVEEA